VSERHLVLLPGFMCDADLWADMADDLARLGQVHYGNVYQDDTLEGMARRVLAESPQEFVLVGFSMGGFVFRVLALMAPERVSAASYADTKPVKANDTAEGRAANRRVAIVVVPDLSSLPGYDELQKMSQ